MFIKTFVISAATLALLGMISSVRANPDWVESLPNQTEEFKFYVGRASNSPNEQMAVTEATNSGIYQAISENFGVEAQVSKESFESLDKTTATSRIRELSRRIELHDFEQIGFHKEKEKSGVSVWLLFRFSRKAIEAEKKRLSRIKLEKPSEIEFSIQGSKAESSRGIVELVSDPSSTVFIDGERYGKTPLRLNGQLNSGEHRVRFEHPQFESVEESFIAIQGQTQRIEKRLVRASGGIKVISQPSNGLVVVSGQAIGTSPTEEIRFPAGEKLIIEVSHADAEKVIQEIEVPKGTTRTVEISMPLKPAFLSASSDPNDATFEIDGNSYHRVLSKVQLTPGTHKLRISRNGFEDATETIELRGGETKTLATIKLTSLSEIEKRLQDFPWLASLDLAFGNSPLTNKELFGTRFGGSIEKKIYGFVGLRGSAGYFYGADGGGLKQNKKLKGFEFSGSVPFYYQNFFIGPEVGFFTGEYSEKIFQTTVTGISQSVGTRKTDFNSVFYGGLIGYDYFWSNNAGVSAESRIRKFKDSKEFGGNLQFFGGIGLKFRF